MLERSADFGPQALANFISGYAALHARRSNVATPPPLASVSDDGEKEAGGESLAAADDGGAGEKLARCVCGRLAEFGAQELCNTLSALAKLRVQLAECGTFAQDASLAIVAMLQRGADVGGGTSLRGSGRGGRGGRGRGRGRGRGGGRSGSGRDGGKRCTSQNVANAAWAVTKLRTSQHIGSSTLSGSPTVNGFCFWSLLATSVTERASEVFIIIFHWIV